MSIAVDPKLLKQLDKYANQFDVSRSAFVCEVLSDAMADAEMQMKLLANPRVMRAFSEAMSAPGVASSMAKAMTDEVDETKVQAVLEFFNKAGQTGGKK